MSVRNLADSLGVLSYYLVVYGNQSDVAHAGDGFMHFDFDDGGSLDLAPSPAIIGGLLRLAGLVFLACLTGIHNRLNFGAEAESALERLRQVLQRPRQLVVRLFHDHRSDPSSGLPSS